MEQLITTGLPRRLPPPDSELTYRLRESTFRIYEPYIARAIAQWPEPVAINPAPLRATTFAARLRDAILRLHIYITTTEIDLAVFDAVYDKLTVVHIDQTVSIGPRTPKGRKPGAVVTTAATAAGIHWEDRDYTDDDVRAIVRLLGAKLISGPVHLKPLDTPFVNELESSFDCAVQTLPNKSIIF